jgi:hypothetical protein
MTSYSWLRTYDTQMSKEIVLLNNMLHYFDHKVNNQPMTKFHQY